MVYCLHMPSRYVLLNSRNNNLIFNSKHCDKMLGTVSFEGGKFSFGPEVFVCGHVEKGTLQLTHGGAKLLKLETVVDRISIFP